MKANSGLLILFILCMFSCKRGHLQEHTRGSANEYMHRASTKSLIANFEKAEREEYQKPEEVIEYLGDIQGLKIMDLGAGSGYFSFRLAGAGARVIAADVNEEFQEYIQNKILAEDLDSLGIELRMLPYDDPKLQPGEVDKVLLVNTYHHIEDRVEYFRKVIDGIKPGGEIVVIDYFKKNIPVGPPRKHKMARGVIIDELEQVGFKNIDVNIELLPYQYVIRANKS